MVVMRDEDDGGSLLIECSQLAHNIQTGGRIQIAGRLVRHDDRRFGCYRTRDRNTLLLTAGHLARTVIHALFQTDRD